MTVPMTASPTSQPDSATVSGASTARVQAALDRAARDLLEQVPRDTALHRACQRLATALDAAQVLLVQRDASGLFGVQACSRESALWAELARLPERWDGSIAGQGPAAQATRTGEPACLDVDDPNFAPWREAARRDGLRRVEGYALPASAPGAVLLVARATRSPVEPADAQQAAHGLSQWLEAAERQDRQSLLSSALNQLGLAAFVADVGGQIVWSNLALTALTGHAPEALLGRSPALLASGHHGARYYRDLWNTIRSGQVWRERTVDRRRDGSCFTARQTITPFGRDGRVTHYLAVYDDISEECDTQRRRELLDGRDPLTGLLHRSVLESLMADVLACEQPLHLAVMALEHTDPRPSGGRHGPSPPPAVLAAVIASLGAARAACNVTGECLLWLPDDAPLATQTLARVQEQVASQLADTRPDLRLRLRWGRASAPVDGRDLQTLLHTADRRLGLEPLQPARRRVIPPVQDDVRS